MQKTTDFIKNLRKFHRITRREMEHYTRIPYNTIAAWERGEREPPEWVKPMISHYIAFALIERK